MPDGATHVHECYGIVTYYKWGFDRYTQHLEPDKPLYCWYFWNGKEWVKDRGVCSRNFTKVGE